MKHREKFAVKEFKNPSGEIVYRVDGWFNGERVRKNFATRKEADVTAPRNPSGTKRDRRARRSDG